MAMHELSSGAEAHIFLNDRNNVVKKRIEKRYRIQEIDSSLRTSRTRHESKILSSLSKIMPVPHIISSKDTDIEMEYVDGTQLKRLLDKDPRLARLVGENLTLMHDAGIMHGDLTTSNMILKEGKLYFIDFGLSFHSKRIEDKAVDIHLFKQALESKHFRVFDDAYKNFLEGYMPKERKQILARLEDVEQRGRYKEKT